MSKDKRYTPNYKKWRKKVMKNGDYKCYFCGEISKSHSPLDCHHIKEYSKFPEFSFEEKNGIVLCEACHEKLHKFIRLVEDKRKKINHPVTHIERDKKIKELYKKRNLSYRALARIFHVSQTRIMQIVKNGAVDK